MIQAIIERCCGLEVHQETVVACLPVGAPGAQPTKEVRTFGAVTPLAKGQLRRKRADLILALDGADRGASPLPLAMQLPRLEAIEADIAALDVRIGERLEPYCMQHALLMQIPGVDWLVAAVLIAEIGVDMSVFFSVYHLAAWAGVCPGSHESAGRQRAAGPGRQHSPPHHPGRRRNLRGALRGRSPSLTKSSSGEQLHHDRPGGRTRGACHQAEEGNPREKASGHDPLNQL